MERNGRKARIGLRTLEKLCAMQCTDIEIASYFNVNVRTIERHKAKDPKFAETMERGRARGKISLRRHQFQMVQDGDVAMAIWLGKQLLGQKQVVEQVHSGHIHTGAREKLIGRIAELAQRGAEKQSPKKPDGSGSA